VAKINYPASIPVPPNGVIHHNFTIGAELLELTAPIHYDHIVDFIYKPRGNGYIDIYNGTFIRSLTLHVEGSNTPLPITINNTSGALLEDYRTNQRLQDFFLSIVESIRHNGFARIYIDGNADPLSIIDLDICIELDAYVIY
jgi:hypothetical protein